MTCAQCRWWTRVENRHAPVSSTYTFEEEGHAALPSSYGECRGAPPMPTHSTYGVGLGVFPLTHEGESCGAFHPHVERTLMSIMEDQQRELNRTRPDDAHTCSPQGRAEEE